MNKEEILNTFLLANIPEIITQEEFDDVKKAIRELQLENKELKDVIEEVREYINSKVISNGEIIDQLRKIEVKELLQILDKAKN
ncbi:MAG: hypothetical protein PUJ92_06145 [Bacilli bacterium]|nr:hypothetical protein [Bacilli bacterium]MDY5832051.1 hypothetical protein [Candidatus Onthovivens sp.]